VKQRKLGDTLREGKKYSNKRGESGGPAKEAGEGSACCRGGKLEKKRGPQLETRGSWTGEQPEARGGVTGQTPKDQKNITTGENSLAGGKISVFLRVGQR